MLGEASFSIGWERFVAAEILFDPTEVMHGAPAGGLPELVLAAIDDVVAAEGGETPEERRKLRGELLGRVVQELYD